MRLLPPTTVARLLAGVAAVAVVPATAQDAQALRLQSLVATCAQCHGTEGRPPAGSNVPALAGAAAPQLREQLMAFRSGSRTGTVMPQLAKGYSDSQIEAIAAWFAARPR